MKMSTENLPRLKVLKPLRKTQTFIHRIGFLPDMHVGETRAVMLKGFHNEDGQPQMPNETQKIINMQWKRVGKLFNDFKVESIFIPGDTFGGINYRESGRYMYLRLPDQIKMARDLLLPLAKNRKVFVWRGTQYHEYPKGVGEAHEDLVDKLRAEGIDAYFMGPHSYMELVGPKRTRRIFVAHEAPTALVNPATLMSRDINWALEGEARGSSLRVDAIVRAHIHTWLHVDHSGIHAVQLPCWLGHTPYRSTIRYFFKLQPTIGGAMLLVDNMGRMRFWGGSYPFSLNQPERVELHRACINIESIDPLGERERFEVGRKEENGTVVG